MAEILATYSYKLNSDGKSYSITCTNKNCTKAVIPSEYNGLPITSIGSDAFRNCSSLTSIEIPNSVTNISNYAFYNCSSLTSIVIPNSVTSISSGVFSGCSSLTSITVDKNNTKYCSIDGNLYNKNATILIQYAIGKKDTSFIIPNSIKNIGNYAFNDCSSLTSIEIPNSVASIGYEAFSDCSSLTSIEIPNSVTSIGSSAFSGCSSLTSIEIPNSVTSIGNFMFYACSSLTSIEIPNSVTSIGNFMFYACSSLTSATIGNSVTSIGDRAFYGCSSLTSITVDKNNTKYCSIDGNLYNKNATILIQYAIGKKDTSFIIPNSIKNIGNYAFNDCISLTSIVLPNSVKSIGDFAFGSCGSLQTVILTSDIPPLLTNSNAFSGVSENIQFYCHAVSSDAYKTATNWLTYADKFIADDLKIYFILNAIAQKNYFASKKEVEDLVSDVEVDLTGYATEDYVNNAIENIDISEKVNIKNGVGEYSLQTPDLESAITPQPEIGFPEGKRSKVTGSQAVGLGYYNKVKGRGSLGLGRFSNIQTEFSAGIGSGNATVRGGETKSTYGRANVGIGARNVITSEYGSVAVGKNNIVGHAVALSEEERQEIVLIKDITYNNIVKLDSGLTIQNNDIVRTSSDNVVNILDKACKKEGVIYLQRSTSDTGYDGYILVDGKFKNCCYIKKTYIDNVLGSKQFKVVTSLPTNADLNTLYLVLKSSGKSYNIYGSVDGTMKIVGESSDNLTLTSKLNTPGEIKKVKGRTHGGYREDTIYLKLTSISKAGHSQYTKLTEQNLNPCDYYTDPYTTISYELENDDGSISSKSKMAIFRLSAKNASGSGDFKGAVALGYANRVNDSGAVATGVGNWAHGFGSFTSGEGNEAHSNRTAVFGYNNILYGNNGFMAGSNHKFTGSNTDVAVFGRWSKREEDLLFAIGNGTGKAGDDNYRYNVFEVYKDNTVKVNGKDINTLGGASGTKLYKHTFYFNDEDYSDYYPDEIPRFIIISTSKTMKYEYHEAGEIADSWNDLYYEHTEGFIPLNLGTDFVIKGYYFNNDPTVYPDETYEYLDFEEGYTLGLQHTSLVDADGNNYDWWERSGCIKTIGGMNVMQSLGSVNQVAFTEEI